MTRKVSEERLNNKVVCKVCFAICKNYISLAKHIQHQHNLSSEAYYRKFLISSFEDVCLNPNCFNKTRFRGLSKGYAKTCSHNCYGVMHTGKNNTFYAKNHKKEDLEKGVATRRKNDSYNHTKETKDKIGIAAKRIFHYWGVSGTTGKHHSKETKELIRQKALGRENPNKDKTYEEIYGEAKAKKIRENIQKRAILRFSIPENNPNWKGGISFEPYTSFFNEQLKDKIRVRDNFICQLCGVPELECNDRLSIHHKDYNKKNNKETNLISLCRSCHAKTSFNRKYWQKRFEEKIYKVIK